MKKIYFLICALFICISGQSQLFTNYSISLQDAGNNTNTIELPIDTYGTLTINAIWETDTSVYKTGGQNPINGYSDVSTYYELNGNDVTNIGFNYNFSNVITNKTSGLIIDNWEYTENITDNDLTITSQSFLSYGISGGNYNINTTTEEGFNISYSYFSVPEPNSIYLVASGFLFGFCFLSKRR